jgi:hypothetical protein
MSFPYNKQLWTPEQHAQAESNRWQTLSGIFLDTLQRDVQGKAMRAEKDGAIAKLSNQLSDQRAADELAARWADRGEMG